MGKPRSVTAQGSKQRKKPVSFSSSNSTSSAKKGTGTISSYFGPTASSKAPIPTSAPASTSAPTCPLTARAATPDSANISSISTPSRNTSRQPLRRTDSASSLSASPVASLRVSLPIILSPKVQRSKPMGCPDFGGVEVSRPKLLKRASCATAMSSSLSSTDSDIHMRSATPPVSSTLSQAAQESTSATPPLTSVCAVARDIGPDPFASSAETSPVRKPFRHDLEIQNSDSDLGDDSSNDSDGFMPLTELLNKGTTAMTPAQPKTSVLTKQTPYTAPCAKRQLTKAMFARAQMSTQKNAEFSVEALLADAAQDIATGALIRESALNYAKKERQQKMREESQLSETYGEAGGLDYPECSNGDWNPNLKETLRTVAQDNDNDAPDVDKVVRAVHNANSSANLHVWHFFDAHLCQQASATLEPPSFPTRDVENTLRGFNEAGRGEAGTAFNIDHLFTGMCAKPAISSYPILEWLLKTTCLTSSAIEFSRIFRCLTLSSCVVSKLTPDTLRDCMRLLGAREEAFADDSPLQRKGQARSSKSYYQGLNWGRLVHILQSIAAMTLHMTPECRLCAATILLKLAADADLMASTAVRMAYMATIKAMFENLDETQLNLFAVSIATTLIKNFQSNSIRHGILRAIPIVHLNLADLRRRLAIAFLYDDATLAGRIPYTFFSLEEAGKLLDSPSLLIHKDTDYLRLCNTIALLDIAIDDGCIPPIPGSLQYDETWGKRLLQDFNSDIDAVVGKLEALARSINDVRLGSIHSTDAKDHINILINRLRYTVRYGGALRVSIYDKILDNASKKPQQWSKLVKSGQAKERGQTAITAFTETVAKPSPVSPIHDSVKSREPDSVFGDQSLASITEDDARGHVPSTLRKKASQRRRSAVPQTPTTSRRTQFQSTALGSSPVCDVEQTPRRSVRILASASKARDGPLRVAVEKQPVH
ncbi:hypothetical protein Cpir12675_006242 [Ceratocystis pirilliformis]|uniref:Uncharacterized protein n=1 Tax=Ceratocystis pirilliformis TaxID=259994 RepID=A0ABR3YIV5_9PEZI